MRKKRVMIVGPKNCGKTTLANAINNVDGPPRKTQGMIYGPGTIDVPASYIENSWMYKHVIAEAQNASHVLILVDQSGTVEVYSPGFAKVFKCPVIGVISKCDLKPENEALCIRQLKRTGCPEPYFKVSISNKIGLAPLQRYLFGDAGE
ncbi:MAG TPA: EutP/PduV family microcompartment system protein [Anaerovoracaceae bacterium]|nr:EutP/PduV family microcompartment system protein [Anaerovoracaceae bacterium]